MMLLLWVMVMAVVLGYQQVRPDRGAKEYADQIIRRTQSAYRPARVPTR